MNLRVTSDATSKVEPYHTTEELLVRILGESAFAYLVDQTASICMQLIKSGTAKAGVAGEMMML